MLMYEDIRVLMNRLPKSVGKRNQHQLCSLSPREFHRWNEVTVRSDQYDHIHLLLEREAGYVQSDPHVDSFLLYVRLKVVGRKLCVGVGTPERPAFDSPSLMD